jgi:hypothetical protein
VGVPVAAEGEHGRGRPTRQFEVAVLRDSRPNISPHSIRSSQTSEPAAFSITIGRPVDFSAARVGPISRGYVRPVAVLQALLVPLVGIESAHFSAQGVFGPEVIDHLGKSFPENSTQLQPARIYLRRTVVPGQSGQA